MTTQAIDTVTRPDRRSSDERRTVLLPEPADPVAPVTARRMRRALLVYAAIWVLGLLPAALGAGDDLVTFGLGLVLPGGGFAFTGSEVLAASAFVAFGVSLLVWWAAGPVVLPPVVWLASAGLAVLTTGSTADPVDAAQVAVAAIVPLAVLAAAATHRVRYAAQLRTREQLNERLAEVEFTITGAPALHTDLPVAESTPTDLAHLRYALDLALQPLDSYDGFTVIDQFREAAVRYQLTALSNGLAMSQFTRTPAFSGYLAEGQRNAIEKMLQRRNWGYWALENAWGNLSRNRDPLDTDENIMLTGWHGIMVGSYESLNDDRYSRPGALTYTWSDSEEYAHDFSSLARQVHRSMVGSDYGLFPCEPNWIYTICNTFGINTLLTHDRLHGTSFFTDVKDKLHNSYETEFLRPDGRIVGVRARHLGLSWNFWAGSAVQLNTAYWLHAGMPDIAQRTWWLLRENGLTMEQGRLSLPRATSDRLDPGNYKLGRDTFGQIAITMAARELGDEEYATAAQATLDDREPTSEEHGARRYADASPLVNLYGILGRFGRRSGLRDLMTAGAPQDWRTGPQLAEAAYPDVLVARAVTDGHALDLVLRPGGGPVRTTLAVQRLIPHRAYSVMGATTETVTADAHGRALVEVELTGRQEVRVY